MVNILSASAILMTILPAALAQSGASPGTQAPDAPNPNARQAQGRADENAVRQAQDAFGTSVGRETIGLYNASSVRGFSPIAAGNARIDGLYFDQVWTLTPRIRRATNIRVGISAQGYPFPAPTGIVDYRFRKPGNQSRLSIAVGGDDYGAAYLETDVELPLVDQRLSLGLGSAIANNQYPSGVDARYRNAAVTLRWNPVQAVEIVPFWHHSEGFDHEQGPLYVPRDGRLPPTIERRRFMGPDWADYRGSATNYGTLASLMPGAGWVVRAGVFRSMFDDQRNFSHLLTDVTAEGTAKRVLIVDPPFKNASTSGELRVTRELEAGPRVHSVHVSLRGRDRTRRYNGSQRIDLGVTTITAPFMGEAPAFIFSEQTHDRTRQWTGGVAYDGRWRNVGELGFSVQKTDYRKQLKLPGLVLARASDKPWLYNVSGAAHVTSRLVAFSSFTRGLEESGVAPDRAANRNELLPAIQTSQGDLGLRYALTPEIKLVAAYFDVRKPYFNFDAANRYVLLGDLQNQGIEMSLVGKLTPRLSIVTGAVLARPRATGEGVRLGRIGAKPVGLASRSVELNLDWRTPWVNDLSLDMTASHTGAITATVDNSVAIPARTLVGMSGRYRFKLLQRPATLRVGVSNLFDKYGYDLKGAGTYDVIAGRVMSASLSADF